MADLQRRAAPLGAKTSSVCSVCSALRCDYGWISGSTHAGVAPGNQPGFSLQQPCCHPDVANRVVYLSAFAALPQRTYHALLHSLHSSPRTREFCSSAVYLIAGCGASLDVVTSQPRSSDQLFWTMAINFIGANSLPPRFSCRQRSPRSLHLPRVRRLRAADREADSHNQRQFRKAFSTDHAIRNCGNGLHPVCHWHLDTTGLLG